MTGIMQMLLASFETGERYSLFGWGLTKNVLGMSNPGGVVSSPVQVNSSPDWADISASVYSSDYVSLGIKTNGTLWAWGKDAYGTLGINNRLANRSSPVQVGSLTNWEKVIVSQSTAYAKKTDGTIWAWGINLSGGVGDGTKINRSSPVQIGASTDWAYVGYASAVKTNGTAWSWGFNFYGNVGDNTTISRSSPVQIGSLTNWLYPLAIDSNLKLFIKTDGRLWGFGSNFSGQLGNGTTNIQYSSPVQIGASTNWAGGSSGTSHSMAYKTDGTLWAWGSSTFYGQLGLGNRISYNTPQQVGALTNWATEVIAGAESTLAIKLDGTLWSWGQGSNGRLGLNSLISRSSPVQVGGLDKWISIGGLGYFYGIRT
jgi:alpha-tubulin suppressor-like RCC1 family protein